MRLMQEFDHYPPIQQIFAQVYDQKDAVFLDSSLHDQLGRFSIIGLDPYLRLVKGETFTINGEVSGESFEDWVKAYLRGHRESNDTGLPLVSGAIGYFSYDHGREKEKVGSRHPRELDIPDCILVFYGQDAASGMRRLKQLVRQAEKTPYVPMETPPGRTCVTADFTKEDYMAAVQRMIGYIIEGDIYIANMTQQLQITSPMHPFEMFWRLRADNPSPFGGYLNYGDLQIVSASPERFLQMRKGHIQTRPIKGTRKRGSTPEEDAALRLELEQSGKDKSELLMIVDLERNDLNRVCVPGSVEVTELFSI